ncbi:MAG: dTDP-4-amino-4,6-dideoxygalactose transaminase, partial [Desulfovibrionaceae bacterium]|nr:dTDP-4-amino-4,6-dideoxygalactose transaminase [Desulfovibrionaceae bacterium]
MDSKEFISFNKPYMTGKELYRIAEAHFSGKLSGDGKFTHLCSKRLEVQTGCAKALLAHSCTAALEMSALLLNIQPGDEIIMPSYTFVSTATAFVLRGGIPVFVDIRADTLNIDEELIEGAITPRTRAIAVVHYAGVACEMDRIMQIAAKYDLPVVEDAAQGIMASYKGKPLGSIGTMGTLSFHETKNIICGEGGALLVNNPELVERAEIVRDTGTNRKSFYRGETDRYTWVDIGSSYLPGELVAAFLWAQLEEAHKITENRLRSWNYYHKALEGLEEAGLVRRPIIPEGCSHNAHMYYLLLAPSFERQKVLAELKELGVGAIFHYVPLHSAPAGVKYGR